MKNAMESNDYNFPTEMKLAIAEMAEIAGYLWQRGWAELNAGNISLNITGLMEEIKSDGKAYGLETSYPEIGGAVFLVTATGARMRDVARNPLAHSVIVSMSPTGGSCKISPFEGYDGSLQPTSELPTHMGIHAMIARRGGTQRAVLHTHATELAVLTQITEFCNEHKMNRLLWSMHPETIIFVPKGVGFVPYTLPGTSNIAKNTIAALQDHDVVLWEKHGVFAMGNSLSMAFDVIDIITKSAKIFLACRSSGYSPEGLTDEQLAALKKLAGKFT